MGIIKNVWEKTRFAKEAREKSNLQEIEAEIRAELKDEIKAEVKSALKEKILKEEVDKALGKKPENAKPSFLEQLGTEFKGSGIGSTEQMNKLMGKSNNNNNTQQNNSGGLSNDKILSAMGGSTKSNSGFNFNRNTEDLLGVKKSTTGKGLDITGMMGHKTSQTGKQVDMEKLIGLKKKKEE